MMTTNGVSVLGKSLTMVPNMQQIKEENQKNVVSKLASNSTVYSSLKSMIMLCCRFRSNLDIMIKS